MTSGEPGQVAIYVEAGLKRTFAAALDWPGWARAGRDEATALAALAAYGSRYARAVRPARLGFAPPGDVSSFVIAERLKGDATTDFGAPGAIPSLDERPLAPGDLERLLAVLRAAWQTLDEALAAARGKKLATGPRGGGRDRAEIQMHAAQAGQAYLGRLGWKAPHLPADPVQAIPGLRAEMETALAAAARGEIAPRGPRGGRRWTARTWIRREAWHALDHAWEIEDRLPPRRA